MEQHLRVYKYLLKNQIWSVGNSIGHDCGLITRGEWPISNNNFQGQQNSFFVSNNICVRFKVNVINCA